MQGLGVIAMQQQDHHDELLAVRNVSKTHPVEKWLGINKLCRLLRMICLPNEQSALEVMCPVYEVMALAPRAFKMGELQDAINTKIITRREEVHHSGAHDVDFSNFTQSQVGPYK